MAPKRLPKGYLFSTCFVIFAKRACAWGVLVRRSFFLTFSWFSGGSDPRSAAACAVETQFFIFGIAFKQVSFLQDAKKGEEPKASQSEKVKIKKTKRQTPSNKVKRQTPGNRKGNPTGLPRGVEAATPAKETQPAIRSSFRKGDIILCF